MPTLEIPNLAAIRWQKQSTPPPIASPAGIPIGPPTQSQSQCAPPWSCQPGLQLCVEQGAVLNSQIELVVKGIDGTVQPVDITGAQFQFTAKTSPTLPDTDPTVIKLDWTETNTPTQGTTWLTLPAGVTATMQAIPYFYQVRMVQSPSSPTPIVTPLFNGTLTVIQPVSVRYATAPTVVELAPTSVPVGTQGQGILVYGDNFLSDSKIMFGGFAQATTFYSANQLGASIAAAFFVVARTWQISVLNSNGQSSNQLPFNVV